MMIARLSTCFLVSLAVFATTTEGATYTPVMLSPGAVPGIGPGVIPSDFVFGKEYTHDRDADAMGGPDPGQIVAWDGIGGAADGIDITLFPRPTYSPDAQIDAIANHNDALFTRLREDRSHLIFSHDDFLTLYSPSSTGGPPTITSGFSIPPVGPIPLSGGGVIGGAAELSVETAGAFGPSVQTLWAAPAMINGMASLRDIDGVELWGPEHPSADSDKYSIDLDIMTGGPAAPPTSVWNLSGTPYIDLPTIVAAVEAVLGPIPPTAYLPLAGGDQLRDLEAFNLDALMVRDVFGSIDTFDRSADGIESGDQIIFSIRQIVDPADMTGYYATGSELFVLDATTGPLGTTYLFHGGHFWSKAYADLALRVGPGGPLQNSSGVIDINAIESVGNQVVPEPGTLLLMALALASLFACRRAST